MKLQTKPQVLKCMLAINLNVNIWSARRKLNPDDFGHSQLPPASLASLGSKKICDPKTLKIFTTLKARAVNVLDKSGVRFLGGWAISENKGTEVVDALNRLGGDFKIAKDNFIKHYDEAVQNWIADNPGWENIISDSTVSADYVAERIAFNWQIFKVVNPTEQKNSDLSAGLQNEVTNLGCTLFDEIAKSAREAFDRSFFSKSMITRKALSPIKTIQKKLHDLSFIEPRVSPVASLVQSALDSIPSKGAISGNKLLMLNGLLTLLNDTKALTQYAQEIIDGRSNENVLDSLTGAKTPEIEPEPQKKASTKIPDNQLNSFGLW